MSPLDILKLILISLLPVAFAIVLMLLKRYTRFNNLKKVTQTIIISIAFSISCILGTLLSVKTSTGAAINVRDASPIIAGLMFGGPAGIISGIVGGVFRFFIAYWDKELMATQLACSIATALAGVFTALIRKFIFNNHHGKWYYGAFIAILVESFHMLMVFITNIGDSQLAYEIVTAVFIPMLIANTSSVIVASISTCIIMKEKLFSKPKKIKLTTKIQFSLAGLLIAAYALVSSFAFFSVYDTARKNVKQNLEYAVYDLQGDVNLSINRFMIDRAGVVADALNDVIKQSSTKEEVDTKINTIIYELKEIFSFSEVNVVGKDNLIHYSTCGYDNPPFDMADPANTQANEFLCLNNGAEYYVQDIQEPSSKATSRVKYAGYVLEDTRFGIGFVQIGLYEEPYYALLDIEVEHCASYRRIEKKGFLAVTDSQGKVVSISVGMESLMEINLNSLPKSTDTLFNMKINNEEFLYYTFHIEVEGYHVVAFADADEMMLPARISVLCITLVQIVAFMLLYCVIYIVIKHAVTNRIENIGAGLKQISAGNLDVKINERNCSEMNDLSNNINKTVDVLKEYTQKEKRKNDEELRFAKSIQSSSLPSLFPLNEKFEIYASMNTAKAVGGDFYDFFFIDPEHIAISVADVSGKGIPAALFMMQTKTIIKNLVESGMPIDEAFIEANHRLCENNEAQMFVTAWLGVIDLTNGHVEYVNAGHNSPIICNQDNEYQYLKTNAGFVLGGLDGYRYKLQSFNIAPGQKIFLYTDGITEAMNKNRQQFGEANLLELINENKSLDVHSLCNRVLNAVKKHSKDVEQSDDITMLCFALNKKESNDAIVVDAKTKNIETITKYVNKLLDEHNANEDAKKQIDVAIDELFSNICYYAYKKGEKGKAKIVIDFIDKNHVAIVFEDRGIPYNPLNAKEPDPGVSLEDRKIGGLGIYIVKKTMDKMEYKNVNGHNVLKITKKIN
ncbi:MAG: SpoIIE family protein phosphatase [Bacilli bacterium]|nr:SpoIIE family protein phosphatase [Bacilli bacterium]